MVLDSSSNITRNTRLREKQLSQTNSLDYSSQDGAVGGVFSSLGKNKQNAKRISFSSNAKSHKIISQSSAPLKKVNESRRQSKLTELSPSITSVGQTKNFDQNTYSIKKDKSCKNQNKTTHGDVCSNLKKFYNDEDTKRTIAELINTIQFLSEKYDEFDKSLSNVMLDNKNLTGQVEKLTLDSKNFKTQNENLTSEIFKLKFELNAFKQEKLVNDVTIKGLQKVDAIEAQENILIMARTSNVELLPNDIESIVQIPNGIPIRSTSTIVKFKKTEKRNIFINETKKKRLTTEIFGKTGKEIKSIYINDHLTKENYKLLSDAIKLKRFGVKYVWTQNGKILLRLNDTSNIIQINDKQQLNSFEENLITSS